MNHMNFSPAGVESGPNPIMGDRLVPIGILVSSTATTHQGYTGGMFACTAAK